MLCCEIEYAATLFSLIFVVHQSLCSLGLGGFMERIWWRYCTNWARMILYLPRSSRDGCQTSAGTSTAQYTGVAPWWVLENHLVLPPWSHLVPACTRTRYITIMLSFYRSMRSSDHQATTAKTSCWTVDPFTNMWQPCRHGSHNSWMEEQLLMFLFEPN